MYACKSILACRPLRARHKCTDTGGGAGRPRLLRTAAGGCLTLRCFIKTRLTVNSRGTLSPRKPSPREKRGTKPLYANCYHQVEYNMSSAFVVFSYATCIIRNTHAFVGQQVQRTRKTDPMHGSPSRGRPSIDVPLCGTVDTLPPSAPPPPPPSLNVTRRRCPRRSSKRVTFFTPILFVSSSLRNLKRQRQPAVTNTYRDRF